MGRYNDRMTPAAEGPGDRIARFLLAQGADRLAHAHGRTLFDHLLGTRAILAAWREPQWLQDAGALHSVYATDVYPHPLLALSRRDEVRAVSSERAERLAYLFAVVARVPLFEAAERLAPDVPDELRVAARCPDGASAVTLARPEISALLVLHMANALEQTRENAMEPQLWPPLVQRLAALTDAESAVAPALATADAGRARYHRYVDAFSSAGSAALRTPYPDLTSMPWHDVSRFSIAAALEREYPTIRRELLALDGTAFRPEHEPIERRGDWDVRFLYQRGKKHHDVCAQCPVTTRIIESHATLRAPAGLIYVSRLAAGTELAPHRGPTNVRLRCHLGLQVPPGDCALRVGGEQRRWEEGRAFVFDDSFEHDAWNRTAGDRLVLVVDLWHPDLTATEIALLEGLQRYALGYAHQYERYWAVNADVSANGS